MHSKFQQGIRREASSESLQPSSPVMSIVSPSVTSKSSTTSPSILMLYAPSSLCVVCIPTADDSAIESSPSYAKLSSSSSSSSSSSTSRASSSPGRGTPARMSASSAATCSSMLRKVRGGNPGKGNLREVICAATSSRASLSRSHATGSPGVMARACRERWCEDETSTVCEPLFLDPGERSPTHLVIASDRLLVVPLVVLDDAECAVRCRGPRIELDHLAKRELCLRPLPAVINRVSSSVKIARRRKRRTRVCDTRDPS